MKQRCAVAQQYPILDGLSVASAIGVIIRGTGGRPEAAAPRRVLYGAPSPVQRLRRLERELGTSVELYIKRDDALRPLYGNKLRYIEYVLGAYDELAADCIVHCGGLSSNYLAQLAIAGAEFGIATHLIMNERRPVSLLGNPLLAEIFGAQVHFQLGSCEKLKAELAAQLAQEGLRPLVIDAPFTNHSAILGYLQAWRELCGQVERKEVPMPQHIFLCSAGNSYLGLRIGADLDGSDVRITAVSPIRFLDSGLSVVASDREGFLRKKIGEFAEFSGQNIPVSKLDVDENFVGASYGAPSSESIAAVRLLARTEGILLDPIYTGKAMAGLLDRIRTRRLPDGARILFIHSGGIGNVFSNYDAFA